MTTKRDKKDEPKAAKRPKLKKEALRDLAPDRKAEDVRGGREFDMGSQAGCSL